MSVFKDQHLPVKKASMNYILRHVKKPMKAGFQEFQDANEAVSCIAGKIRRGRRAGLELLGLMDDPDIAAQVHGKAARYLAAYENVALTSGQRDAVIVSLCLVVFEKYDGRLWEHVASQYPGFFDVFGRRGGESLLKGLAQEYALEGESTREFLMRQAIVPVSRMAEYLEKMQAIYANEFNAALMANLEEACQCFGKDRDEALFMANAIRYVDDKCHERDAYHCGEETFDKLGLSFSRVSGSEDAWKAYLHLENRLVHMHLPCVWVGKNIDIAQVSVEICQKDAGTPGYTEFANGYRLEEKDILLSKCDMPAYRVKCGKKVLFDFSKCYGKGNAAFDQAGRQVDPAAFEGIAIIDGKEKEVHRFDVVTRENGDLVFATMDEPEFEAEAYEDTFVWVDGEKHPLYRCVKSMRFCHASQNALVMETANGSIRLADHIVSKGKSVAVYETGLEMLAQGMTVLRVFEEKDHRFVFEKRLFIDAAFTFEAKAGDDGISMHASGSLAGNLKTRSSMKERHPCAMFFELDGMEDSLMLQGKCDVPCFRVNHGDWHLFEEGLGDMQGRLYFTGFQSDQAICGKTRLPIRDGYVRLCKEGDVQFMKDGECVSVLKRKSQAK